MEYLSRYTHRVAISNGRLLDIADGKVTFTYRDRRDGNRSKECTIAAAEFLRRFLMHVTPAGLCRMRHYGFLSNCTKKEKLPRCRELLGQPAPPVVTAVLTVVALILSCTGIDVTRCPHCKQGTMVPTERIMPTAPSGEVTAGPCEIPHAAPGPADTS